jgi:hypothetical protein
MPAASHSVWIVAAALFAGCGPRHELAKVEGTVRAGGQPLANVVVTFLPESAGDADVPRSVAQTDAAGRFALRTELQQEGAVVGKHRVVVEDLAINSAPRSSDGTVLKRPPARFSASYSDLLRTPLMVEVKRGEQTIDLKLTP